MSTEALMDDFISKPKINRLPPFVVQNRSSFRYKFDNAVMRWSVPLLVLIATISIWQLYSSIYSEDARLLALVSSTDEVIKPSDSSLYFKDTGGIIDGQMVKIQESQNSASGKNGDKRTERELLSIVGKY